MGLTRTFKATAEDRAARDPAFRDALLVEAMDSFLAAEFAVAKAMLRDHINMTIGFERLAAEIGGSSKSLMRMLSPAGNPTMGNLFRIVAATQKFSGLRLKVVAAQNG